MDAFAATANNRKQMIMSEWQPIETAPRDGTEIIIYGKTNNWKDSVAEKLTGNMTKHFYIEISHWTREDGEKQFSVPIKNWSQPTHWMPLPPLPTIESM